VLRRLWRVATSKASETHAVVMACRAILEHIAPSAAPSPMVAKPVRPTWLRPVRPGSAAPAATPTPDESV
jgi:hypothetical protein